jgi:hypothetical protein
MDMAPRRARPVAAADTQPQPSARPVARPIQRPATTATTRPPRPVTPMPAPQPIKQTRPQRPIRPQRAISEEPIYDDQPIQARPTNNGGWRTALQVFIGLVVIAAVASAIVVLYIRYYQ